MEKLKGQNQALWADTVKQAELIFSTQGVQNTMDLMPASLQGAPQLKTTINVLEGNYGPESTSNPKANVSVPKPDSKDPKYKVGDKQKSDE